MYGPSPSIAELIGSKYGVSSIMVRILSPKVISLAYSHAQFSYFARSALSSRIAWYGKKGD